MPRTALSVQTCDRLTGLDPTYTSFDATNGMEVSNASGDVTILIKNDDASSKTLTVVSNLTVDGLAVSDPTFTVPASSEFYVSHFNSSTYNATGNLLQLDIDDDTSVTVAAVRFGVT